jgi:uncharacterized membrane protein
METLYHSPLPSGSQHADHGIRSVGLSAPFRWLKLGWHDLRESPSHSLTWGLLFVAAGLALLAIPWPGLHVHKVLVSGFLIVGPILALGFYGASRRIENGDAVDFSCLAESFRRNPQMIAFFGLILAFALSVWERLSAIVFALFIGDELPGVSNFVTQMLFSGEHSRFVLVYALFGLTLGAVVYALSVITVPMLMDRKNDVVSAMLTSLRAVARNPLPMLIWAVLIAALVAIGFATWLLGLAVIFPLLGHATWHAYRDLIE